MRLPVLLAAAPSNDYDGYLVPGFCNIIAAGCQCQSGVTFEYIRVFFRVGSSSRIKIIAGLVGLLCRKTLAAEAHIRWLRLSCRFSMQRLAC